MPGLRPYQRQAVRAWELGGRKGVIALPEGSGKTTVAIAAMAASRVSTLVVVPGRAHLAWWLAALGDYASGPVGQVGDGRIELRSITVATLEGAQQTMERYGARFEMLVVDEAQHLLAEGRACEALEMCTAPFRLGLAVSPPEVGVHPELERLVGPEVFRRCVQDVLELQSGPFEHWVTRLDLTEAERQEYEARYQPFERAVAGLRGAGLTPDRPTFLRAMSSTPKGREALHDYYAARRLVAVARRKVDAVGALLVEHADDPVVVSCATDAEAYALSHRFCIPAITGDTPVRELQGILERLRRRTITALVCSRNLEGELDAGTMPLGIVVGGARGGCGRAAGMARQLRARSEEAPVVHEFVVRDTFEEVRSDSRDRDVAA